MGKVTDSWTTEGRQFMKNLRELAELEVRIGYQQEQGPGDVVVDEDGRPREELVDIATWNEFGTENIPSRPFMRDSVDKHMPAIGHMLMAQKDAILKGSPARKVLNTIGVFQADLIQTEMEQGDFVENAHSTIEMKGSDKPLIDTGTMKNSVHHWIVKKGDEG